MTVFTGSAALRGISALLPTPGVGYPKRNPSKRLSGVVLNQNLKPENTNDYVSLNNSTWYYQEFFLPADYTRGPADTNRTPDLTGFQLFVGIDAGYATTAALDYTVEHYVFGVGWTLLASGVKIGTHTDGNEVWIDIYFDQPIDIDPNWIDERFRLGVRGRAASADVLNRVVSYDSIARAVTIDTIVSGITLEPEVPFTFDYNGKPSVLVLRDGVCYYSVQQGINRLWYSVPNPLASVGNSRAMTGTSGATPVQDTSRDVSFMFRVLAAVADEGVDFLGNRYRSVAVKNLATNLSTQSTDVNSFWLSKPNPSKFAVESLYFDVRTGAGQGQVIDRLLLDPVTPGMYFNIYYATDPIPASSEFGWDEKLWTHVPLTFRATRRDTYALPNPIMATFLKIEFSQLQASSYSPGTFQKPITYKKFPKWVADYFILRGEAQRVTEDHFIPQTVGVAFDILDFAYNYYVDDLMQDPSPPSDTEQIRRNLDLFFANRGDVSDQIDGDTLLRISTTLQPYLQHPALTARFNYLLGTYAATIAATGLKNKTPDYPVEELTTSLSPQNLYEVSSTDRDQVVFEQNYPVMFFFVPCRHRYRKVAASFQQNRAYFAGVREIAFLRDHYTVARDDQLYIESADDNVNIERNDFSFVNHLLQAYPNG